MFAFFLDESAGTTVEYAVMLGLIIAAAFAGIATFGAMVNEKLSEAAKNTGS